MLYIYLIKTTTTSPHLVGKFLSLFPPEAVGKCPVSTIVYFSILQWRLGVYFLVAHGGDARVDTVIALVGLVGATRVLLALEASALPKPIVASVLMGIGIGRDFEKDQTKEAQ